MELLVTKVIALPLQNEYTIIITATDDGKMDYSICEYDADFIKIRTTAYTDIQLKKGAVFQGKISNALGGNESDYDLKQESSLQNILIIVLPILGSVVIISIILIAVMKKKKT